MSAARLLVCSLSVLALGGCGRPATWVTGTSSEKPNLAATGLSSTPDHFVLGTEAVVHVTVVNTGAAAAGAFDVEFAVTPHGGYYPWPRGHVDRLGAGASTVVDFTVEVSSPEDVPIRITVDPDNQVKETSETDNVSDYVRSVSASG